MRVIFLDSGMGIIPFIKEILKQNIRHDYHFILDEFNFPYGNKSNKELSKLFDALINKSLLFNPDLIFIACNTLSCFLKKSYPVFVDNILSYNIKHLKRDKYLVATPFTTSYLKKLGINNVIALDNLASLIENEDIIGIIKYLKKKRLPSKIILGCTHYPNIDFLFSKYARCKVFSYEDEVIKKLKQDQENMNISIYTNKKGKYQKFFSSEFINFYTCA